MLFAALKRKNNPLVAITKLFHSSDLYNLQKAEETAIGISYYSVIYVEIPCRETLKISKTYIFSYFIVYLKFLKISEHHYKKVLSVRKSYVTHYVPHSNNFRHT